jgi:hypothetical protein
MDFDLEKAIQAIDRKIAELQHAKHVLVESFGGTTSSLNVTLPPIVMTAKVVNGGTSPQGGTRKETIVDLLSKEGPLGRSEIHKKTGIPLGSIAAALNDKKTFISKDGKWSLLGSKAQVKLEQMSFIGQENTPT